MTQTYLVPAKTAELIRKEQFTKTVNLETLKFIDSIKNSSVYKSALKTNLVKQEKDADIEYTKAEKKIESLKTILKNLPPTQELITGIVKDLFRSFNIYRYNITSIDYDFDLHLENIKKTLTRDAEYMANRNTDYEFDITSHTIYQIEGDMSARIKNRIRMSKIESYDKIVKQVSSKMDYQNEIKEIYDFIVEINKLERK